MKNEKGFDIETVIEDTKQVILNPVEFYRNMSKSGGLIDPIIFVLAMGVAAGLVFAFLSLLGMGRMAGAGLSVVIMMPIMFVIGSFISAAILYLIWKLMGSENNYEVAYRCVAYSAALFPIMAVLTAIPYLGTLVHTIWATYLIFIASTIVHELEAKTSLIVFGALALIGLMFNLGGEKASRAFGDNMEQYQEKMKDVENMTPEEIGKAAGEFMRGFEGGSKE